MTILFRCDASFSIGSGHVIRCRTLARLLQSLDHEIIFICRRQNGDLISLLEQEFKVIVLPEQPLVCCGDLSGRSLYQAWLGCSQKDDATDVLSALVSARITQYDWLVVDHYGLDQVWEEAILSFSANQYTRLLVLDDLADRNHICHLLLDQNYFAQFTEFRYRNLIPASCTTLLGPHYALLAPEYSLLHPLVGPRSRLRRILIYFGGVDQYNLTGLCLEALNHTLFSHLDVDVVLGLQSPHYQAVSSQVSARPRTYFHSSLDSLASLIASADLSIGAGGTTTWERSCLQLPSIVIAVASNQVRFSRELHEQGYIEFLGLADEISLDDIRSSVLARLDNHATQNIFSTLTDGFGSSRVIAAMFGTSRKLLIRQTRLTDISIIKCWTNGRCSFDKVPNVLNNSITSTSQLLFDSSADADLVSFTAMLSDRCPIGYLEFSQSPDTFSDVSVRPINVSCYLDKCIHSPSKVVELFVIAVQEYERRLSQTRQSLSYSYFSLSNTSINSFAQSRPKAYPFPARITVLSDPSSWINESMPSFVISLLERGYFIRWIHDTSQLIPGDICFILSFSRILSEEHLNLHSHNLVVHESALPFGQGWSPMTWQILNGMQHIPITLFEASVDLDAGPIYLQHSIHLQGFELVDEWRNLQSNSTFDLCLEWLDTYSIVISSASEQSGESSFFNRRDPSDSVLDPHSSIADQFNLLRVVDNKQYPAHFMLRGRKYRLLIYDDNPV